MSRRPLLTVLLCGLLAVAPSAVAEDLPEFATPPTMTDADKTTAISGPATALASGNVQQAGDQLFALIGDPSKAPVHGAAWAMLAGLYEKQGLSIPATLAWSKALELDPTAYGDKVLHAAELAAKTGDDGPLAPVLGNNVALAKDGASRNELARIAGRYHLRQGNYGPALGALLMGDKDAPGFADVELLRGIVLAQQQRYADAIAPLLTAQTAAAAQPDGAELAEAATLNVARAYYADEKWGQSILWYAKIPRSSDHWLEAQFERAWAHFRAEDMNGTLALLMNHGAPYFDDWYFPEQDLLRAYAMFLICKFPDASREMDAFAEKYAKVQGELDEVGGMSAAEAFDDVKAFRAGDRTRIPGYVLLPFRTEDRFGEALRFVDVADAELAQVDGVPGLAGSEARKMIEGRRDARIEEEGQRVVSKMEGARTELADMLQSIEITKLDLLSLEQQMYERAAATGVLDQGSGREKRDKKARKGFREWEWQGEYWADELGWYVMNTTPECPAALTKGGG